MSQALIDSMNATIAEVGGKITVLQQQLDANNQTSSQVNEYIQVLAQDAAALMVQIGEWEAHLANLTTIKNNLGRRD